VSRGNARAGVSRADGSGTQQQGEIAMNSMEELARTIRWNERGLVPVIAQDADNGEVLMMAWMNRESLALTLEGGRAVYFSRSRNSLWRKGDTSGHTQTLVEMRVDCDADCLLMKVRQVGAACHTGNRSCFYRTVSPAGEIR